MFVLSKHILVVLAFKKVIEVILYLNINELRNDSNAFMLRNKTWIGRYKTMKR